MFSVTFIAKAPYIKLLPECYIKVTLADIWPAAGQYCAAARMLTELAPAGAQRSGMTQAD